MNNKLSIIIPLYNEERTIASLLEKVLDAKLSLEKEIIIVNDGSTDKSISRVEDFSKKHKTKFQVIKKQNGGKGSAIRAGLTQATGDIIIIQDADLEYDPRDYQACIQPIIEGESQVVYGSRRLNPDNKKHSSYLFYLGVEFLNLLTNTLYGSQLTDQQTCYKTFSRKAIQKIKTECDGFEWESEVTAKVLKSGTTIKEIPITYNPRSYEEGKKIRWYHGIRNIITLLKYRFKP